MCDNFKCYSLNVVHACSIVVHKWVRKLGYISPFVSLLLFSAISISISNIFRYYFYTIVYIYTYMCVYHDKSRQTKYGYYYNVLWGSLKISGSWQLGVVVQWLGVCEFKPTIKKISS